MNAPMRMGTIFLPKGLIAGRPIVMIAIQVSILVLPSYVTARTTIVTVRSMKV